MSDTVLLTAEEFAETKYDFREGGRWTELLAGQPVQLLPPDEWHGTVVLNLTRALAEYMHARSDFPGYCCHEIGVVIRRQPDTVRCPAISLITTGPRFAEADSEVTFVVPALVVELNSSPDRRRQMTERLRDYQELGVGEIVLVDTRARSVAVVEQHRPRREHPAAESLRDLHALPGFEIPVLDLFRLPASWK